jgi:hypothetical protein
MFFLRNKSGMCIIWIEKLDDKFGEEGISQDPNGPYSPVLWQSKLREVPKESQPINSYIKESQLLDSCVGLSQPLDSYDGMTQSLNSYVNDSQPLNPLIDGSQPLDTFEKRQSVDHQPTSNKICFNSIST